MRFPVSSLFFALAMGWATSASAADDDKLKSGSSDAPTAPATAPAPAAPKLRLTADLGVTFGLSDDESWKDDGEDLKDGKEMRFSCGYLVRPDLSLGLMYSRATSSSTGTESDDAGLIRYSEDLAVSFVGVQLSSRSGGAKAAFIGTLGLGQVSYERQYDLTLVSSGAKANMTATGTGLGVYCAIGGEFVLHPKVALALELTSLTGTVKDIEMNGHVLGDSKVNRLGLSGGIHFYL